MHFLSSLLPVLAAYYLLALAKSSPLRISLEVKVESIDRDISAGAKSATHSVPTEAHISSEGFDAHMSSVPSSVTETPNTAKVLFWNGPDFKDTKKRYQVPEDKCFNLPQSHINNVLSAKLEPKIWYCTFYPERDCQAENGSNKVHQLSAGDYDWLFPDGTDFVSFKCKLYEKMPDPPPETLSSILTSSDPSSMPQIVMPPSANRAPSRNRTPLSPNEPRGRFI
ncbi:hypothetical protein VTL71DRAFT_9997 [Oculimacula yallundae]|uniref:Uncharacterized protein n=1 Tax=Oculimacula yallundae TaxID=86028 RepID=A0ABR4BQ14_9HELO